MGNPMIGAGSAEGERSDKREFMPEELIGSSGGSLIDHSESTGQEASTQAPSADTPVTGEESRASGSQSVSGSEDRKATPHDDTKDSSGTPKEKPKSRYQRTVEWRKSLEEREKNVAQREAAIAEQQRKANEPPYSLDELKRYRAVWAKEAEFDEQKAELVRQADAKIAEMEGRQSYEQQWRNAEAQLRQADPDFGVEGTPIDIKIREILNGPSGEAYRKYPLGIVAVYDLAKRLLLEEENTELQRKFSRAEEDNKRLHGLTSIGSGAPGQMGSGSNGEMTQEAFRKLSLDQMRERLRRDAARASR
jgi:hypothetical protein